MSDKKCTKCLISVIAIFVIMFVFDFIWHGVLLKDLYQQTSDLWRPEETMPGYFAFNILTYLLFSVILVLLFKSFILNTEKDLLLKNSLKGGLFIGALLGIMGLGFYAYMPIPLILAVAWLIGNVLSMLLVAYALYLLNR